MLLLRKKERISYCFRFMLLSYTQLGSCGGIIRQKKIKSDERNNSITKRKANASIHIGVKNNIKLFDNVTSKIIFSCRLLARVISLITLLVATNAKNRCKGSKCIKVEYKIPIFLSHYRRVKYIFFVFRSFTVLFDYIHYTHPFSLFH